MTSKTTGAGKSEATMERRNRWARFGSHALLWLVLGIVLWRFVMVTAASLFSGWRDWLALYVLAVCTYYLGVYRMARMLLVAPDPSGKKLVRLTAQLVVVLLLSAVAFSWFTGALAFGFSNEVRADTGIKNLIEVAFALVGVMLVGYFTYTYRWGINQYVFRVAAEAKLRRIEAKLRRVQQAWVQQDLPPHLLFNSLSVARALTREDSEKAREAVTLIAGLAKFYIEKCKYREIPLPEELEQFHQLQRLYALRFGRDLALDLQLPEDITQMTIIPMLLIVLLENMAKYGVLTKPERPATLQITRRGKQTRIIARNVVKRSPEPISHGLGIAVNNIRKQLQLRYPNQSGIEIIQSAESYTTELFFIQ